MASSKKNTDIMKKDLYKLFDIAENATTKQIKKAYRIKALKCHPDKNPDNPKAAELFHQLSKALEILSDVGARAAYDHLRKARKAAEERNERLDSERKKVKLDLEARERAAEEIERKQAKRTMKEEIERLREEGSRILEEEQRRLREQLEEERKNAEAALNATEAPVQLKLKWKSSKDDPNNGGYSEDLIRKMLSKFGQVSAVLVSRKKKGTAVVEFLDPSSANLAVEMEMGNPSNPLKITYLNGKPPPSVSKPTEASSQGVTHETAFNNPFRPSAPAPASDDDFETAVLKKLQREQERRRTLAQDIGNDEDS